MGCGLAAAQQTNFYLHDGDRVVFYGDSITEQRLYTSIIETYVALHPYGKVSFVNSGWGGDRVTGGGGGDIDTRLNRDVLPYKPTVVTIMLGMNDGGYKAESADNDQKFFDGYRHIVERLQKELPNARLVLLQPSPYDEVTRPPAKPVADGSSYNEALVSFGKWIANYSAQMHLTTIDLNTGMVKMLEEAKRLDPDAAKEIIPDHVHPSFGGHLFMAYEVLKGWGASPIVSEVDIDASGGTPHLTGSEHAKVSSLSASPVLSWSETDDAVALPFRQWQDMWGGGSTKLVIKAGNLSQNLNQEILRVKGLKNGTYSVLIDGVSVGAFNNSELDAGVNLGDLKTPQTEQAHKVYELAVAHEQIHFDSWRNIGTTLESYSLAQSAPAMKALDALDDAIGAQMRQTGAPVEHHYQIVAVL
jgi:lysophospholipase L1-like esterase